MSVTGHSNCRHPSDFYETPAWCTRAILRRFGGPIPGVRTVLDPACGRGAILNVVRELWPYVVTIGFELDGERAEIARSRGHHVTTADALTLSAERWQADLIVQNPPFKFAMPFVERSVGCAAVGAISLQGIDFAASKARAAFWKQHPADMHVLSRRPSFAISVKCGEPKGHRCAFAEVRLPDAERPKVCPGCGGKVAICTSDSSEYAWFCWGSISCNGRWYVLDEEAA